MGDLTPRNNRRLAVLLAVLTLVGVIPATSALAAGTFVDDDGNVHEANIEYIAAAGITRGCNETNDRYCPSDIVTRGQMAAFINRALGLNATTTDFFVDDTGSIFEDDINRLAAAGITRGCDVTGTSYCPDDGVTRGQIAAFLNRALDLDPTDQDFFVDDNGSIFEDDINALAATGVTLGCGGGLYCINEVLKRDQMASLLARALQLSPTPPPPPPPPPRVDRHSLPLARTASISTARPPRHRWSKEPGPRASLRSSRRTPRSNSASRSRISAPVPGALSRSCNTASSARPPRSRRGPT